MANLKLQVLLQGGSNKYELKTKGSKTTPEIKCEVNVNASKNSFLQVAADIRYLMPEFIIFAQIFF